MPRRKPSSVAAEDAFRASLRDRHAELLDEWLGAAHPHRVLCRHGHHCEVRPDYLRAVGALCATCEGGNARAAAGRRRSDRAAAEFRSRLDALGVTLLDDRWRGANTPHPARCAHGHDCTPTPATLQQGGGACRACAGKDPDAADAEFRSRLDALGVTLLDDRWRGANTPHPARCAHGHDCTPVPSRVRNGATPCAACRTTGPVRARPRARVERLEAFRERLATSGATLVEPEWLGSGTPHRVRCRNGHDIAVQPGRTIAGRLPCPACRAAATAERLAAFADQLAAHGATLIDDEWLGADVGHRAVCAQGHPCRPRPTGIRSGEGPCRTCAGRDPDAAFAEFAARLHDLGATLVEERWLGALTAHRVRCAQGHLCTPRPNGVQQGAGICRTCAGKDPVAAEAAFRARLDDMGATLLEPEWLGANVAHRVRCANGHDCRPRPGGVHNGQGICRACAGCAAWDTIYAVTSPQLQAVKFGVTSGDPQNRLGVHRRDGYTPVARLARTTRPGELEATIRAAATARGHTPIRGREYFAIAALPIVIDTIDNWLATDPSSQDLTSVDASR